MQSSKSMVPSLVISSPFRSGGSFPLDQYPAFEDSNKDVPSEVFQLCQVAALAENIQGSHLPDR